MKKKRFSWIHLALLLPVTALLTAGVVLAVLYGLVGREGLSLLEGYRLVQSRFVGAYEPQQVADAALEGMVDGLGDRWSYFLTREEYEAQNQRRTNQYVGVGVTVSYESEEGLPIRAVTPGGPAEAAGLLPGELITGVDGFFPGGGGPIRGSRAHPGTGGDHSGPGDPGDRRTDPVRGGDPGQPGQRPGERPYAGGQRGLCQPEQFL